MWARFVRKIKSGLTFMGFIIIIFCSPFDVCGAKGQKACV